MSGMAMIQRHILFDEQDIKAIEMVQRRYGLDTFSQAVRLAVRLAAQMPRADAPLPPSPKHALKRSLRSLRGTIQGREISDEEFRAMRDGWSQARRNKLLARLREDPPED
jgi:hypothetical protein